MRNTVHQVLVKLSSEALLFLAVNLRAYLAVVVINGSFAVNDLLYKLFRLVYTA